MRHIRVFDWVTADGYFTASDGTLDWVVPDEAQATAAVASIPTTDTVLFGRRTYELFEGFWRRVPLDAPTAPDPHDASRGSREHRVIAAWLNDVTKIVFSRTLKDVTWQNTRLVHALDPREIEAMKTQPGQDMIVFGSGSIASQLTRHGLIDEYQLVVCPVLIGNGRSLLTGLSKSVKLVLVETTPYPSGDVLLRYARAA